MLACPHLPELALTSPGATAHGGLKHVIVANRFLIGNEIISGPEKLKFWAGEQQPPSSNSNSQNASTSASTSNSNGSINEKGAPGWRDPKGRSLLA